MQRARALRGAASRPFGTALIIGDAAAPLGTGVLIRASQTALVDTEVTGAADAPIVADGTSFAAGNVFQDVSRDRVDDSRDGARAVAGRDNGLVDEARSTWSARPRFRRGR